MKLFLLVFISTFINTNNIHNASWYGQKFHGKVTASGDIYDMNQYSCAAIRDYDFGDSLLVTNVRNGKSVKVIVNDRGAFKRLNRTIDLSKAAFEEISNLKRGVIKVTIEKLN